VAHSAAERIARNNRIFKEANEGIRGAAAQYSHELERIPFLCECAEEGCVQVVRLTPEEYNSVRADPRHYLTAIGHEAAEAPVGRVVERNDAYVVVEKE
jgi:hypothetical protein